MFLNRSLRLGLLELTALDLGTNVLSTDNSSTAVKLEQLAGVVARALEHLDLADEDILKRVDVLSALLNLAAHDLRDELGNKLTEVARRRLALDDLEHLAADRADLRALRVGGLPHLVGATASETNGKHTEEVAISGLNVLVRLDEGLPLADERTELVLSEVHAVEVGQAVAALNLVDLKAELAECLLVILVEVGQRLLEDTALERIACVL